jgi:hypothetical protein
MLLSVATPKTRMVNVRLTEKVHEDFKIACELRGGSMTEEVTTYPDALERLIETLRPDTSPAPFGEDVMELPLHP